ncbi:MAG: flagellar basal body L-ring protein FlgH [Methylohalobius sp. ZOD2]
MTMVRLIVLGIAVLSAGCNTLPESMPRHNPAFAPAPARYASRPLQPTGSIYQAHSDMRLFENLTARRVGDILTIRLVEETDATKDSELQIQKGNNIGASAPILFGQSKIMGVEWESEVTTDKNYNGEGQSSQSNQLTGTVTVTVVEVLPNGNLRVQGEKRLTINDGHEYVRLAGIVRPVDIDVDNAVPSTKVADATIMYTGEGAMADVKEVGWMTRFFNSLFFPF